MEKSQRPNLQKCAFKALLGGMIAYYMTAIIATSIL